MAKKAPNQANNAIPLDKTREQEIILISKLSGLEKFCLSAYILSDLNEKDKLQTAYKLSRPNQSDAKETSIYVQARRWFTSDPVQAFLTATKRNVIISGKDDEGIKNVNITKEEYEKIINKHLIAADKAGDSKTVRDLAQTQMTFRQWNKTEDKDEETQIKYYLPLKCSQCQLYKSAKMTNSSTK
ncbi:hypothetical protein [uncultured Dysgonomonas sp.]|uniref:Uncharacterized protein n=1 Tax=uncultured Dysgonomonas sp. TaxID=206096 RepID=A0A212IY65_9BACT|nr:hypothetical protein [uncultured Dysgonomonas sp.]SBV92054.1 conserved hypothetical protein [uncultured Dysgonomonas sp.]